METLREKLKEVISLWLKDNKLEQNDKVQMDILVSRLLKTIYLHNEGDK